MTKIELDRDSKPARVFHRVGLKAWVHPMADRATCEQCERDK